MTIANTYSLVRQFIFIFILRFPVSAGLCSCHVPSVQANPSRLSSHSCPCPVCLVLAAILSVVFVLFKLPCSCWDVLAVLSSLSWPSRPVLAACSVLHVSASCSGCPVPVLLSFVPAVLPMLSCSDCSGCPVLAVLSRLSFTGCHAFAVLFGCPGVSTVVGKVTVTLLLSFVTSYFL